MTELLASVRGATFADGSVSDVELWRSSEPVAQAEVFAAMVAVDDGHGRYAVHYSPRRQEWGIPGGWREDGESVTACAVREVREETGLELTQEQLQPWGFERFAPVSRGRWPRDGGSMQLYRATVEPTLLVAELDDSVDPTWLTGEEFAQRAGGQFWWQLLESVLRG